MAAASPSKCPSRCQNALTAQLSARSGCRSKYAIIACTPGKRTACHVLTRRQGCRPCGASCASFAMRSAYRLDTPLSLLFRPIRVHRLAMEQTTRLYADLQRRPNGDSGWSEIYDRFVARLTALEAGRSAPSAGARLPDLQLT